MIPALKRALILATVLLTFGGSTGNATCAPGALCPPRPRIIVSPVSQRINYTSPLRMTCIAYLGRETVVDSSSSLSWYTEAREVITNSTQVNVYSTAVVRQGLVFMESILEACAVYSNLVGELSCGVMNGGGEDSARWNITYDVGPPVIVVSKPASQVVNYTSALQMNCTSLVLREESSDSNIAWWVENTQIRNSSETLIYTNRERVGNMVFIRSTLVVSRITYSHLGELSCIAENSLGRDVATWTLTPTVEYPPPIVTTTSGTKLVYFGEPINATCTANVGPIKAYNMYPSMIVWFDTYGQQIRPATNQIYINTSVTIVGGNTILESTLLINRVDVQHVGVLECQVDNLFGIDYATVSVNTYEALRAPRLLLAPVNQTIDCRSRVTLVCVVNAFPLPDIWWTFNDIRVDPGNANILENGVSRFGQNFSESYLDICEFEQPGYFKCSASNSLGNATSNPVLVDIDLQSVPPVIPPLVTSVDRTSINDAVVTFEPQSPGTFEVTYYIANDSTTPYLTEKVNSTLATIEQPRVRLLDLESCNRYWVVISGHYCTLTGSTTPALVDYYSSAQYELTVTLGGKDEVCNTWVTENPEEKAMDMEVGLQKPASDCGFSIPCYEGSRWECTEGDPTKVTFKTQLVEHDSESADQIKKCIDEWIKAGLASGRVFPISGSNVTVRNYEEPTISVLPPVSPALPIWVWVVVVVAVVLLVVCLVTALITVVTCTNYRRRGSLVSKKQRFVNSTKEEEDDNGQSGATFAVVENPLYAENEGDVNAYLKDEEEGHEVEAEGIEYEELKKSEI